MNVSKSIASAIIFIVVVISILLIRSDIVRRDSDKHNKILDNQLRKYIKSDDSLKTLIFLISKDKKIQLVKIDSVKQVIIKQLLSSTKDSLNLIKKIEKDRKIPNDSVFLILNQKYVEDSISHIHK